jgi:hypothetical protein
MLPVSTGSTWIGSNITAKIAGAVRPWHFWCMTMARRSRRQRRKAGKTGQSNTAIDSPNSEMENNLRSDPGNIVDDLNAIGDAASIPSLQVEDSAPLSQSVSIPSHEDDCEESKDEEVVEFEDHESFRFTSNEILTAATSTSSSNNSTVESIGLIQSSSPDDEDANDALMLSPIAVSREFRVNRDLGLTVSDSKASFEAESSRGSLDIVDSYALDIHSTNENDSNLHETGRLGEDQENSRETGLYEANNDEKQLEVEYDMSSPPNRRLTNLSPVMESKGEFDTPETPWNVISACIGKEDGQTDDMNDSAMTSGSARDEEIARTQVELGHTSLAFLHRLRGAAFRRKKALVNSRDDMVAKERSHREGIEAARLLRRQSITELSPETHEETETQQISNDYVFKARPLPNAEFSGSVGVPKVDKRPITVPVSPLLGFRRTKQSNEPSMALTTKTGALPLPKTTGESGRGGLSGLPRVIKRPVTVPVSPMLGLRRQDCDSQTDFSVASSKPPTRKGFKALLVPKSLKSNGVSGVPRIPSRPTTVPCSPLLGGRRKSIQGSAPETNAMPTDELCDDSLSQSVGSAQCSLVGVKLLSTPSLVVDEENEPPNVPYLVHDTKEVESHPGYEPHSTARARQRAEFDAYLVTREKERLAEESHCRLEQARALKRELGELRKGL